MMVNPSFWIFTIFPMLFGFQFHYRPGNIDNSSNSSSDIDIGMVLMVVLALVSLVQIQLSSAQGPLKLF